MAERPSCYDKAVELLGRRSHFRRQLADKLRRRGYDADEIAATLERLAGAGYLDDRRTAAEYVEARLARGPEGRARLVAELERRGAPPEAVAAALEGRLPADDLPLAREAARRWRRRGATDPRALARHLGRKGFSQRAVLTLLEEAGEDSGEE
jgi:regulatory protein